MCKMQRTEPGQGFHNWHYECTPSTPYRLLTTQLYINDDYEGGELCFWDKHIVEKHANCMHVSPSNHLFMHEVKPITKGTRYSVIVWFSYHKGDQWLT